MNTLDWRDTLIIVGILLALTAAERIHATWLFARERRLNQQAVRDVVHGDDRDVETKVGTDHEACTSCATTICFCPTPKVCASTINLGCLHLTHPELLCADCRAACGECRAEDQVEAAVAYLRDDAAIRSFR